MDPDLRRLLDAFQEAADFVERYRFDLTDDYLALIEQVEALPQNQSGADKSGRWRGSRAHARSILASVRPPTPGR